MIDKDILNLLVTMLVFAIVLILVFRLSKKIKWKSWVKLIIALILSLLISMTIYSLIIQPLYPEVVSVSGRECVPAGDDILSCDGTGINTEQDCEKVCLEETNLNNVKYLYATNLNTTSRNLGYVTFNTCYCYEGVILKYMYTYRTGGV